MFFKEHLLIKNSNTGFFLFWGKASMKEENIIQCFKNKNCKECPSNEDCNKELKVPKKKKREYIYIDLSNFWKEKKESG